MIFDGRFFEKDPLFWPIESGARAFSDFVSWPPVTEYGARIAHRAPVQFRKQPAKPRGKRRGLRVPRDLYDGRIIEEGWVPTRPESWHDFFNMLVWAAFPEAKHQLHARQHRAQSARIQAPTLALPNARTREQDALALLDEGGVIVMCRAPSAPELASALAERRSAAAHELFASGQARAAIFGHALYEGLVLGRKDGWGAGFLVPHDETLGDDAEVVRAADRALAGALRAEASFQGPGSLCRVDLHLLRP